MSTAKSLGEAKCCAGPCRTISVQVGHDDDVLSGRGRGWGPARHCSVAAVGRGRPIVADAGSLVTVMDSPESASLSGGCALGRRVQDLAYATGRNKLGVRG